MNFLLPLLALVFSLTSFAGTWSPPDFSGQEQSLGYSENLFEVPQSLRQRVDFWIDIYSKYSTQNGVLHDGRYLDIIYKELDFSEIQESSVLSRWEKYRRQARMVRDAKREIKKRLRFLNTVKDSAELSGEDLRLWNLFKDVNEANKFLKASFNSRLRFQLGQRDQIIKGIFYAGRYMNEIEQIFRDEGIPVELTRLPFVESSFNIYARSKVGASGIWQFMRSTARYRLRMNGAVDERNDAIFSSRASARFLRRNYEMLQSWPLAITGYNHGPNGMRRLAERYQTKDLATLIEKTTKRSFGFASENFYACFLAILEVEGRADYYLGSDLPTDKPLYREEVRLPKSLSWRQLKRYFGGNSHLARSYNPHIRKRVQRGVVALNRRDRVFLPVGRKVDLLADLSRRKEQRVVVKKKNILEEISSKLGLPEVAQLDTFVHRL